MDSFLDSRLEEQPYSDDQIYKNSQVCSGNNKWSSLESFNLPNSDLSWELQNNLSQSYLDTLCKNNNILQWEDGSKSKLDTLSTNENYGKKNT